MKNLVLFLCLAASVAAAKRPNVIVLVADDQRRVQANFLDEGRGKNLTPHMDRLSSEGIVLSELHSPSPVCVPSRFVALTGIYASRADNRWMKDLRIMHGHTFIHQEPNVTPTTPTIAHDLKRLGYVTGAVGKNHVIEAPEYKKVDARLPLSDPKVLDRLKKNQEAVSDAYRKAGFDFAERFYHTNPRVIGPPEVQVHNLDWVNEAALQFIDESTGPGQTKPFFLYYGFTAPHAPHNGYLSDPKATPIGILDERPKGLPARESIKERLAKNGFGKGEGDMLWVDDCVGSLVDKLESRGVLDNTIIIYFSDHGVESGKTTCYQGGMRTFGFVWGPEHLVKGNRKEKGRLSLVDLAPTIYDYAGGVAIERRYDGVSLKNAFSGMTSLPERTIYGEIGHSRAIIKGKWKYIALRYSDYHQNIPMKERKAWLESANEYQRSNQWKTFEENDPAGPFGHSGFIPDLWDHERKSMNAAPHFFDADQLYNLNTDPNEQVNLAENPEYAAVLKEMQAELAEQLQDKPGPFAEFKPRLEAEPSMEERIRVGRRLMLDVFH
ncbi:MAG: sulfatase-like hydrolase/transferase [Verrucomicrobiota bacterium]